MIKVEDISGIGQFVVSQRKDEKKTESEIFDQIFSVPNGKAFLVIRPKTVEVRCDGKLRNLLREKYESVMESRYFGRGGIEIVDSGQLAQEEIEDLVRLSYNLTLTMGGE